jgi:lipopolysaccharide export system permease protein
VKIITRYVLKEHIGPFVFALSALTSLLLLQYIARRFGDLVGRGLAWQTITEFFLLSIPFTLAMTLPMSVLVATLYAFSRMASENEITAFKAGGVSTRALMRPAVIAACLMSLFMLYFNDQLLPRANHQLATLQMAILRTKPTFALKSQVINTIREGSLYLRAGSIEEASGLMHDVTIYDLSDSERRKTIYADSGTLTFAPNRRDLAMRLFHGWMITSPTQRSGQVNRVYFHQDVLKIREVANVFQTIDADTSMKGDREMSVCEMQRGLQTAQSGVRRAQFDSVLAKWRDEQNKGSQAPMPKPDSTTKLPRDGGGIGAMYCNFVAKYMKKYFTVKEAEAADLSTHAANARHPLPSTLVLQQQAQDTSKRPPGDTITVIVNRQYVRVPRDSIPDDAYDVNGKPLGKAAIAAAAKGGPQNAAQAAATQSPTPAVVPGAAVPGAAIPPGGVPNPAPATAAPVSTTSTPEVASVSPEISMAKESLDLARHRRNRYAIEIQKKFSLAAACIVLVLVGAPLALRFPRGGVGLVIGASFFIFAVYYVGLIGGESLANKNYVSPFWAMWTGNFIFFVAGVILIMRMGNEGVTNRGGAWGERVDAVRQWFERTSGRRSSVERATR